MSSVDGGGLGGNAMAALLHAVTHAVPTNVSVQSLSAPVVVSHCGNGVCELGELCGSHATAEGCCLDDCPVVYTECPSHPSASTPCSGHGTCFPASGVCVCEHGFGGLGCDACAAGFHNVSGKCVNLGVFAVVSARMSGGAMLLAVYLSLVLVVASMLAWKHHAFNYHGLFAAPPGTKHVLDPAVSHTNARATLASHVVLQTPAELTAASAGVIVGRPRVRFPPKRPLVSPSSLRARQGSVQKPRGRRGRRT